MTIQFPDLSHFKSGIVLDWKVPALLTKATQGTSYRDPTYYGYARQAAGLGMPFGGYHYLEAIGGSPLGQQVTNALAVLGPGIPLMVDVEKGSGTLGGLCAFVDAYRAAGGLVTMAYVPEWYWSGSWGSPDLAPLIDRRLALISSNYSESYSDTGVGWQPYGGMAPTIWQYTDRQPLDGQLVDYNAYKGTVEQLRAVMMGETVAAPSTMNWTDDVIPNPPQRPDSPGHVPPGTNLNTQYAFMLGDTWNLAIQQRDLLRSIDGRLAAIAAALTAPPAVPVAGDVQVSGIIHVGPAPAV